MHHPRRVSGNSQMDGRRLARARRGRGADRRLDRLGRSRAGAGDAAQGRRRHRHRRPQRQGLQRPRLQGPQGRPAQLGVKGRVFISKSAADYVPNLSTAAHAGLRPRDRGRLPHGRLDSPPSRRSSRRRSSRSSTSRRRAQGQAEERRAASSSPSRRQAASPASRRRPCRSRARSRRSAASRSRRSTRSSPATSTAPRSQAGHRQTLNGYSQDFVAQDKCKEVALNQIGQGSDVVFQVAGGCGLGALTAAKEHERLGHRRRQRPGVPRHAHPDERDEEGRRGRLRRRSSSPRHGKFKGGVDGLFNVKNDGVGYGKVSVKAPNRAALIAKLNAVGEADRDRQGQAAAHRQVATDEITRRERAGRRPALVVLASAEARAARRIPVGRPEP